MTKAFYLGVISIAAALGGACVVAAGPMPIAGIAVTGPPPAPMIEARPSPIRPRAVWVGGYWHWTGMQYTWIPGHWEAGPEGARWRAPRYLLRDGVYYYEPGGWMR
jgi:hypothetical protein